MQKAVFDYVSNNSNSTCLNIRQKLPYSRLTLNSRCPRNPFDKTGPFNARYYLRKRYFEARSRFDNYSCSARAVGQIIAVRMWHAPEARTLVEIRRSPLALNESPTQGGGERSASARSSDIGSTSWSDGVRAGAFPPLSHMSHTPCILHGEVSFKLYMLQYLLLSFDVHLLLSA